MTAGHCWYTIDDSLFYIDYEDSEGVVQRKALNANDAATLTGASLATILNNSELEIPTSAAVFNELALKANEADVQAAIGTKANVEHVHSWNELKDRPFGAEESVESTLIVDRQPVTATADKICLAEDGYSASWNYIVSNTVLTAGKQYRVTINDKQYIGTAVDGEQFSDWGYEGGAVIPLVDESGNEVGHIGDIVGAGYEKYCYYDGGEVGTAYTVSFEEVVVTETVRTLDEQYIPETISRTDHTHSWNDLEDKPFYSEGAPFGSATSSDTGDTLYWDGNTANLEVIHDGLLSYYRISPAAPSIEELETSLVDGAAMGLWTHDGAISMGDARVLVCREDNTILSGYVFKKGIYALVYEGTYVSEINISGYTGFKGVIKTLDEKYIPDTIARIEDIPVEATDDEMLNALIETDMLMAVTDADGAILTDENGNIILW